MKKKFGNLFLICVLALSLLSGCGNPAAADNSSTNKTTATERVSEEKTSETETQEENSEETAKQLMVDLTGSYQ